MLQIRKTLLLAIIVLLIVACSQQDTKQIRENFKTPPANYLPTVYWFWNGEIGYEQIKWQLEEMKRSNTVESVVILAWEGLDEKEYLSDEWFDKIKYACEIAKEQELTIWLYDEIRWPSGHAGGNVLKSNPELNGKCLSQTEKKVKGSQKISIKIDAEPVAIIAGKLNNNEIDETTLVDITSHYKNNTLSWDVPQGEWSINTYAVTNSDFKPTFFDLSYVDLLDPNVAKKFIELTHEEYYKRMPEYFGNVIKAIITDEPGVYCNLKQFLINPGTIAWTPAFLKEFKARKNYDLKKYLPAIWHNIGKNTEKVRIDFYDVVGDLLQESYLKPLHDWSEAHNIKLNIQPVHEETLKYTTILQGDYFKAMEYSHLQGVDEVYSWDKKAITPKIAASATRSFGHQDLYCEVFGAYGWDVTLEKMKAITDWLFTRGVNRLQLSSFYFAMEGEWRMEIPPSLFHQNVFWEYLPNYTNYTQRLSYMLTEGRNISQTAILYPIKNVHAQITPNDENIADKIDRDFIGISNTLLANQLDFDYINEETLINKTEITSKKQKINLTLNTKDFYIDFEVLILPHIKIIEEETLNKIIDFYEKGGKIIAFGDLPKKTPEGKDIQNLSQKIWKQKGKNTNDSEGEAYFVKNNLDSLNNIVKSNIKPDVKLKTQQKSINYIHKIKSGLDIYFISNTDSIPVNTSISLSKKGIPQIWNAENGNIANAKKFTIEGNRTILPLKLARYGSQLIIFDDKIKQAPHVVETNMSVENINMQNDSVFVEALALRGGENNIKISWKGKEYTKMGRFSHLETVELSDIWNFEPKDKSFPEECRGYGSWTEEVRLGIPSTRVPPRYESVLISPAHPYFSGTGIYSRDFLINKSLMKYDKFILNIGDAKDIVEVWLNGEKVGEKCWQPFELDITNYIKQGENDIKIMVTNTMANKNMLSPHKFEHGETWGKVLKSGLTGRVEVKMYDKHDFVFVK